MTLSISSDRGETRLSLPWPSIREMLHYDPDTGYFTWRTLSSKKAASLIGERAGCLHKVYGYWVIRLDGRLYRACRLAWFWTHGEWPSDEIDHINGDRADDRLCNLREASRKQNAANTRGFGESGFKGVSWHKGDAKWRARYANKFLGNYDTREQASDAYRRAAIAANGDFARW